jgi:hypothetical protein
MYVSLREQAAYVDVAGPKQRFERKRTFMKLL